MANPLERLLKPRLPAFAVGIESDAASVVQLERAKGRFVIKRAASIDLPPELIRPGFEAGNLSDPGELARALTDLITSSGLMRQRKWSAALPEASIRSTIVTIDSATTSRREIEEMFEWKIERAFGAPASEIRLSREQLAPDGQKQTRYLVHGIRLEVLAEYESVFAALRWHVGLILPRHAGEEQWLRNGPEGDGLLLTGHEEGFTAVLMRGNRPLTVRSVFCDAAECDDELHRVLLFYRDRVGPKAANQNSPVNRLLVVGEHLDKARVAEIAQETFGVNLSPMGPQEVGLVIPGPDLEFDAIAAPAGLARLAW